MIKLTLRRNLIYPLQYLIWTVLRDLETILISYFFEIDYFSIYTLLMFLGELLAGLIIYLYQNQFSSNNKTGKIPKFLPVEYTKTEYNFVKDSKTKIIFLIFTIGFYDFIQFIFSFPMTKFTIISGSFELRLRGTFTITTALFYYFVLGLPIFKHQFFSLVAIGICILIVIITELFFQEFNIYLTYGEFFLYLLFIFLIQFNWSFEQLIEKYLFEYNQLNPFFVLMIEGIFGIIFCFIYSFFISPFDEIIQFKNDNSTSKFIILIVLLILYIVFSGFKNSFRVITTKIYSPTASTFIEYIFNPILLLYRFLSGKDFISYSGKVNYAQFIINLIISLIMTFLGSVYNELLVLFCCGLERDTHIQVTKRSDEEKKLNDRKFSEQESILSDYLIPMKNFNQVND